MNYSLLQILFFPLLGAATLVLARKKSVAALRVIALVFSLVVFAVSLKTTWDFLPLVDKHRDLVLEKSTFVPIEESVVQFDLFRFAPKNEAFPDAGAIRFFIGLDGLNVFLLPLSAGLFVASILAAWNSIKSNTGIFFALLFVLEFATLGAFLSLDIIQFYAFFEFSLVPLLFLIALWGGANRLYAARKVFIYTLVGGLFTMIGIIALVSSLHQETVLTNHDRPITFSIPDLVSASHETTVVLNKTTLESGAKSLQGWQEMQKWIFLLLIVGFAIKVPVVPFHTWQPTGYFEAPTSITLIMSGILAKLGVFGFLRICVPILPHASFETGSVLFLILGAFGVLYGAACAIAQDDIRKMLAYSSLSHLGFCLIGIFSLNETGLSGAILQMVNHGINIGVMFFLCECLIQRYGTTRFKDLQGLGGRIKWFAGFTVFFTMSSVGLPGLNGFIGEVLCVFGLFDTRSPFVQGRLLAGLVSLGMVLGAWYFLGMVLKVFFGAIHEPVFKKQEHIGDLSTMEACVVLPTALLCLILGLYPQPLIEAIRPETRLIAKLVAKSTQPVQTVALESGNK